MDRKKLWYFVGCKPSDLTCEHCKSRPTGRRAIHTLELHVRMQTRVCLQCAEDLVRKADKGLPTWADSKTAYGGLGFEGWTSRWHWEDYNGTWVA
jgi:hypothetical protein